MSKVSTIYFRGKSGREYCFQVWPAGTKFKAVGGVYILTKRVFSNPNFAKSASHECVGIGETEDLSSVVARKDSKGEGHYVCVLAVASAEERTAIEEDLVEANLRGWNPLSRLSPPKSAA